MPEQLQSFQDKIEDGIVDNTLIKRTVKYVWDSLMPWCNDVDCPVVDGEEELNEQFHDYLNSQVAETLPMIYFRHEQKQEGRRRIDMATKPRITVVINGRRYTRYQPILVIEGKRLPAPSNDREREYVTGENDDITGGIQRFKTGAHGKEHGEAIIVGYVQAEVPEYWFAVINGWISDLKTELPDKWSMNDELRDIQCEDSGQRARSFSEHSRVSGCRSESIRLHHFWIQMKRPSPCS